MLCTCALAIKCLPTELQQVREDFKHTLIYQVSVNAFKCMVGMGSILHSRLVLGTAAVLAGPVALLKMLALAWACKCAQISSPGYWAMSKVCCFLHCLAGRTKHCDID